MKFINLIIILSIVILSSCSGEKNSGGGVTIADMIEAEAGTAAAQTISLQWGNDTVAGITVVNGVDTSAQMDLSITYDAGNRFNITGWNVEGSADNPTVTGSGSATYDYITDTFTIVASGSLTDTTPDTVTFTMTITVPSVALNTLSQASKYDAADNASIGISITYDPGGASERTDVFTVSAGVGV